MRKLAYCRGEWERLEDGSRSTFRGTNSSHHRLPWMEAGGSDPVASSYPLFWWIPAVPVFCTEKDVSQRCPWTFEGGRTLPVLTIDRSLTGGYWRKPKKGSHLFVLIVDSNLSMVPLPPLLWSECAL
ncbi:hypothetical protein OPV22_018403 [Ensete ventricosum]|uniref:Uncharacterized protein n=1 Tax=Ensete ventricosum TaxID=4639 RepID=A0AAV8QYK6_ENSVE|nr:hypothetical protein OPV22_018403 [Ensete ventricosum]